MSCPASGSSRFFHGGSWSGELLLARVALRFSYSPGNRGSALGFRLMRRCT